ncbi:MAG: OsmC family protein [Acidobacteriota bacterium]
MVGTFGGALEARKIDASNGRLTAEVRGEVELDERVLILRRIHVTYSLAAADEQKETIERVHGFHARFCPVFRSVEQAIVVTTSYEIRPIS